MQVQETNTTQNPKIIGQMRDVISDGIHKVGHIVEAASQTVREVVTPALETDVIGVGPAADANWSPRHFGATCRGQLRETNEDQFLISELDRSMLVHHSSAQPAAGSRLRGHPQGYLLMVADGVGGRDGGDLASETAVRSMAHYAFWLMPWDFAAPGDDAPKLAEGLRHAIHRAQESVADAARGDELEAMPGTTLTAAYVCWPNVYVVHVGDSRCYLYRDGALHRLTQDHTLAEVVGIDGASRAPSMLSNALTNVVGGKSDEVEAELRKTTMQRGDVLFLCTDGVTSCLDDEMISEHLRDLALGEVRMPATTVQRILEAAAVRGGQDDMTAVVGVY